MSCRQFDPVIKVAGKQCFQLCVSVCSQWAVPMRQIPEPVQTCSLGTPKAPAPSLLSPHLTRTPSPEDWLESGLLAFN